ncbi:hypothetical protein [Luteibacter yeojuensis]
MSRFFLFLLTAWSAFASLPSFASGGSYLVDDAAVTPASHCQLESWLQFRTAARTATTVPACSWGAVEFSAQLTGGVHAGAGSVAPGVKWQVFDGSRVSTALDAGVTMQGGRVQGAIGYAASTVQLDKAGRWLFNVNLGATHQRGEPTRRILGGGIEFAASASATLLAEVLDTAGEGRTLQAGIRLPFGDNSIDLVVGRALGQQAGHWINMGLNLAF